jgi:hypothetical protein
MLQYTRSHLSFSFPSSSYFIYDLINCTRRLQGKVWCLLSSMLEQIVITHTREEDESKERENRRNIVY